MFTWTRVATVSKHNLCFRVSPCDVKWRNFIKHGVRVHWISSHVLPNWYSPLDLILFHLQGIQHLLQPFVRKKLMLQPMAINVYVRPCSTWEWPYHQTDHTFLNAKGNLIPYSTSWMKNTISRIIEQLKKETQEIKLTFELVTVKALVKLLICWAVCAINR